MSPPAPQPPWKQEVNQRLAAHKSRKGLSVVDQNAPSETQNATSRRAAQAAARVAARYAKAPSYSEMQAAEARAALHAAEVATRAALEAQAVAQAALFDLESAVLETEAQKQFSEQFSGQFSREEVVATCAPVEEPAQAEWEPETVSTAAATRQRLEIRWEPDLPVRAAETPAAPARREAEGFAQAEEDWWAPGARFGDAEASAAIEAVEPATPIHANLIQFPRELVATRRMRPRLTGAQHEQTGDLFGQLSIFEVDPSTISMEASAPAAAVEQAPAWSGAEWSGIELDEQPEEQRGLQNEADAAAALELAPFGYRLMATVVDSALIVGAVCAGALVAANRMHHFPALKAMELGAVGALMLVGLLYQALFALLGWATPGMRYAHVALCTFDDENPTREQVRGRLGALLLSLLPVGLGIAWAIFDEDHLSWHDRLSRTYLRKY